MMFMSIVENFEKLCNDARKYAERSIDNKKLSFIEDVSLLLGDIACGVVLFMLLFVIFLLVLVMIAIVLIPLAGLLPALLVVASLTAIVAFVLYKKRNRLFVDHFVRRLCVMFFEKNNSDEQ